MRDLVRRPAEPGTALFRDDRPAGGHRPGGVRGSGESGVPDSLLPGEKIDLNTAHPKDLERLPGIGEKRALAIADHREEQGPFETVEELLNVPGIGEGILAQMRDYCTVGTAEEGAS